jgi:hypothetical protein
MRTNEVDCNSQLPFYFITANDDSALYLFDMGKTEALFHQTEGNLSRDHTMERLRFGIGQRLLSHGENAAGVLYLCFAR